MVISTGIIISAIYAGCICDIHIIKINAYVLVQENVCKNAHHGARTRVMAQKHLSYSARV